MNSMIKSMTGFGRCEICREDRKFTVEMKSVNHRYLDISIRMPKKFNFFESAVRNILKNYLYRGKVDVFIIYEDFTPENMELKYNKNLADQYMKYFKKMEDDFGIADDITVSKLSRYPEVLIMEEQQINDDVIWSILSEAVTLAVEQMIESRIQEGESLRNDLVSKLDSMASEIVQVEKRSPVILEEYRQKLEDKVKDLLSETMIEENRIATEVVLYADKLATDEETVRLHSHIQHMRATLLEGGTIGRKMDFIAQEMNREANTILSKANDIEISNIAINLKTEIEKIREQIQNIE
jgi:uncharacterized protein (TIGR00255 family)